MPEPPAFGSFIVNLLATVSGFHHLNCMSMNKGGGGSKWVNHILLFVASFDFFYYWRG